MTKAMQPPKPIEEMTEAERERWEELLEEYADSHSHTEWDTLEDIRQFLNSSKIEAMHYIKKQSRYGINCPYYLKAKALFERDEAQHFFTLLEQFLKELPVERKKKLGEGLND
jgi:heme-degrading monooxygenase HmoA